MPKESVDDYAQSLTTLPYSRKIWQGIKYDRLADLGEHRQINSAKLNCAHGKMVCMGTSPTNLPLSIK